MSKTEDALSIIGYPDYSWDKRKFLQFLSEFSSTSEIRSIVEDMAAAIIKYDKSETELRKEIELLQTQVFEYELETPIYRLMSGVPQLLVTAISNLIEITPEWKYSSNGPSIGTILGDDAPKIGWFFRWEGDTVPGFWFWESNPNGNPDPATMKCLKGTDPQSIGILINDCHLKIIESRKNSS
mgnify:CR=1 FL=1